MTEEPTPTQHDMISDFQCLGCMLGSDPSDCESFKFDAEEAPPLNFFRCSAHCPGTIFMPGGRIYLGMPKGFNKVGALPTEGTSNTIRLWLKNNVPVWDKLNIPVWAMEHNGFLFVRTYMPRINEGWVDVIEGMAFDDLPVGVINVIDFIEEID